MGWLRRTPFLVTLLLASLGGNLFLGGMVLGRATLEVTQGSQTRRSVHAMVAALPEGKRDLVRREIGAAIPRVEEHFAALRKARAALAEDMARPELDAGALERGFAAVQTHTNAIRAELQQAMMRALPALSQEERRALVNAMMRHQKGSILP